MIAVPRKTLAAFVCLALGTPLDQGFGARAADALPDCTAGDALCEQRLHGRVVNDASVFRADASPSSEAERATLAASGLAPSELRRMREQAVVQPAPAVPSQVSAQLGDDARANFVSGRAELTPAAEAALDMLVASMDGLAVSRVVVVGHTDSQRISARLRPVYPDNQALSEARAATVAGYIKRQLGLDAGLFSIAGKGPTEPVDSNDNPAGMAKNRRVSIEIWGTRAAAAVAAPAAPAADLACGPAGDSIVAPTLAQPFQLSIDGAPQDGQLASEADRQRCVDVALAS
ncbi:MAG TPA: OmpA family protein, partial [Rhodanobacter sp.]|nr:OmpA family protein [Rhodanobacter sp.]